MLIEQKKPLVFAHWHGDELAIVPLAGSFKICTMTSTSADGSLIDFVVRKFGGATSRGSSTRGGARALIGLIRLVKAGHRATIAVDGPKGPIHEVKPGVFEMAQHCDAPIVPVGVAISRAFIFKKSWNKARLPLPFSQIVIFFSSAFAMSEITNNGTRSPKLALALRTQIFYATQQATQFIAGNRTQC